MPNYLEILRLDHLNYSQRTIEATVHCSRHTVRSVLQAAKKKHITWPLDGDVSNRDLEEVLFPEKYRSASKYTEPDYSYIHRELAKPGVTMALLWEEYCRKCHEAEETPYMSTQFGEKYRRWARVTKATMRIQHKPGDAIQVDWAGDTLIVVTGASAGMGEAIATRFAQEGAKIVAVARRAERLDNLVEQLKDAPGTIIACTGDIGEQATSERMINMAVKEFSRLDVLINCAFSRDDLEKSLHLSALQSL